MTSSRALPNVSYPIVICLIMSFGVLRDPWSFLFRTNVTSKIRGDLLFSGVTDHSVIFHSSISSGQSVGNWLEMHTRFLSEMMREALRNTDAMTEEAHVRT